MNDHVRAIVHGMTSSRDIVFDRNLRIVACASGC